MDAYIGKLVHPGQILFEIGEESECDKLVLGPGLKNDDGTVMVTKSGVVRQKNPHFYWLDCVQKRYIPAKGDSVLGTIVNKSGDTFRVDVGSSELANLSYLAFEGATKRNRPDVKVGDLVFAKLSVVSKHVEAELVCIDSYGRSNGYGVIREGGYTFTCTTSHARRLLRAECPLLKTLGQRVPYEMSVGVNGRVWVRARSPAETVTVMRALLGAETVLDKDLPALLRSTDT